MLETEYPISGDPAATLSFPGVMAIIGSATGAAIVCTDEAAERSLSPTAFFATTFTT